MSDRREKREAAAERLPQDVRPDQNAPPPQEAFEYDDDVTQAAVSEIQARADKILSTGKWVVVDGYAGKR